MQWAALGFKKCFCFSGNVQVNRTFQLLAGAFWLKYFECEAVQLPATINGSGFTGSPIINHYMILFISKRFCINVTSHHMMLTTAVFSRRKALNLRSYDEALLHACPIKCMLGHIPGGLLCNTKSIFLLFTLWKISNVITFEKYKIPSQKIIKSNENPHRNLKVLSHSPIWFDRAWELWYGELCYVTDELQLTLVSSILSNSRCIIYKISAPKDVVQKLLNMGREI